MNAPRNFFDVVVVGTESGGLVAAALLSKKGYRVAVVAGPPEPAAPLLVPGGRAAMVLGWVFTQLGLMQEMRNQLRQLDPGCQIVLPRHRVDLASRSTDLGAELKRELADDAALATTWIAAVDAVRTGSDALLDPPPLLPPEGMREVRAWKTRLRNLEMESPVLSEADLLRTLPEGHALRDIASGCVRFLSPLLPGIRPGVGPSRLFGLLTTGMWVVEGGRPGLRTLMTERLKRYGATMIAHGPVVEIEPSWRGEVMVRTEKEPIGTRAVVYAGDARHLPSLLPEGGKRRKLEASLDRVREVGRRRVLRVRTSRRARPAALGPLAIADPKDGLPPVLVRVTERGEECVFHVVFDEPIDVEKGAPLPKSRALDILRWVVPFVDDHLLEGPATSGPGDPLYAAPEPDGPVDFSLLSGRTPYRQVFIAGHQVLPALGIEGEFLSGIGCQELVARHVKRKDLLGR